MATTNVKTTQLVYLCSLFDAVNKNCKEMKNITYTSGESDTINDRDLDDFQVFLCKLAQICDTITGLVALKAANGPRYLFASNNRNEMQLQRTAKFLRDLLDYVGSNPDNLGDKPLQKQVL
jgi:pantothenate kinase